ncbi:hypothetical protein [Paraflavisolibacter sp. H34]|uniref:hypothetical protein n=1 Tax=Huijunlia imazamoxiresistens TaxID=3127457 RepID=UPI0030169F2A
MLRSLVAILFIVAFAVQSFSQVLIVADYYAHTEAFAQNCENKARPQLKCHGKCQMMKKLQEEEKKNGQNPDRKAENKAASDLSFHSFFSPSPLCPHAGLAQQKVPVIPAGKVIDRSFAIFHPPCC